MTRHYTRSQYYSKNIRLVYCEVCGLTRTQTKHDDKWLFGRG